MISVDDYLYYVDLALDGMTEIVVGLGDELANQRPELPGANSPYQILAHCLGVMEYWGGAIVAGRAIVRDREAEFVASGPVAELAGRAEAARRRLAEDIAGVDPAAPPRARPRLSLQDTPMGRTNSGALGQLYHELAQHHGHLEITRDILRERIADD